MTNFRFISTSFVACAVALIGNSGVRADFSWFTKVADGYYQSNRISNEATFDNLYGLTPGAGLYTLAQLGITSDPLNRITSFINLLYQDGIRSNQNPIETGVKYKLIPEPTDKLRNELRDSQTPPLTAAISTLSNAQMLLASLFSYDTNHPDFAKLDLGFGSPGSTASLPVSEILLDGNLVVTAAFGGTTNAVVKFMNRAGDTPDTATHLYEPGIYGGMKLAYNLSLSDHFNLRFGPFGGYTTAHLGGVFAANGAELPAGSRYAYLLDKNYTSGNLLQLGSFGSVLINFATDYGTFSLDLEGLMDWFRVSSTRLSGMHGGRNQLELKWKTNDDQNALQAEVTAEKVNESTSLGGTFSAFGNTANVLREDTLTVEVPNKLLATADGFHFGGNLEFTYLSPKLFQSSTSFNVGLKANFDLFWFPSLEEETAGVVDPRFATFFNFANSALQQVDPITSEELLNQAMGVATGETKQDYYSKLADYLGGMFALRSSEENVFRIETALHLGMSFDTSVFNKSFLVVPIVFDTSIFVGYRYSPVISNQVSPVLQLAGEEGVTSAVPRQTETIHYGSSSYITAGFLFGTSVVTEQVTFRVNYQFSLSPNGTSHTGAVRFVISLR